MKQKRRQVVDGDGEGIVAGDEEIIFGKPRRKRKRIQIDDLVVKATKIANDDSPEYGDPVSVSDLPVRKDEGNKVTALWISLAVVFIGVVVWLAVR